MTLLREAPVLRTVTAPVAVRVAHLVAWLRTSSGIPPAAFGICEAIRRAGGTAELFAGHAEPDFDPATEVPCRAPTDSRLGRRLGFNLAELEHVGRRRAEGWAVHVHGLWSGAGIAERWSRPAECVAPFVLSPHGMFAPAALARSRWRKRLVWWVGQRRQVAAARVIHVTSEAERDDVRRAGIDLPIARLPLPVRCPLRPVRELQVDRPLTIGFLGRIAPIKRLELLLDAFARTFGGRGAARLQIAGPVIDARYDALLRARAGGWPDVRWVGEVAGRAKDRFFAGIDLLVLPSASENFGVVVTEALARGVPVAAARGTPWRELATTGLGFHGFDDVAGLGQVLEEARALGRDGLQALGAGGPAHVAAHHGYDAVGARWVALHQWLLGRAGCPDWVEFKS